MWFMWLSKYPVDFPNICVKVLIKIKRNSIDTLSKFFCYILGEVAVD